MSFEKRQVDKWVEHRALGLTKAFYPTALLNDIELPLPEIFERLVELSIEGILILKWEIRCPICHRTLETITDFTELSRYYECDCGGEIEVKPEMLFPIFEIPQKYKDFVRKNQRFPVKKKSSHTHNRSSPSAGAPLTEMLTEKLCQLFPSSIPGFSQFILLGGDIVEGNKYSVGNVTSTNGNVSFGDRNTNTVNNNRSEELTDILTVTQELLTALKKSDIPKETQDELQEVVSAIAEEASKEKPNKISLTGMLDGLTKAFGLIEKSPVLITVFEKWQKLFS